MATGAILGAASSVLKAQHPQKIIVAIPVAPLDTCQALSAEADQVICPATPNPFYALGFWHENFAQVTDDEVRQLLEQQAHNTRMSSVLHSDV
jgi:putative phosphoribosyl transferase